MDMTNLASVRAWVTEAGLSGSRESDLLQGFCERMRAAGLPVARATVVIDTLHPVHEGRVFRWRHDQTDNQYMLEYGRTVGEEKESSWHSSPFYHLLQTGEARLRRRLAKGDVEPFPVLAELRDEGQSDYLALIHRFAADGVIGEMDCVYSSWTTEAETGFSDEAIVALADLVPALSLAVKCASLARIAETLVETYLGRDAGRRVLAGKIARGVADRIDAVLWYSDLSGFTRITESAPPEQIIPMLNDYAEAIISAVHEKGGDVLKLIGDGTLAIFRAEDSGLACRKALAAEAMARKRIAALREQRQAAGLAAPEAYLGLHIGEVFYGNVGSQERLDFTVVGPAVNEVARIAAMCRSADQNVLVSKAFVQAAHAADRGRFISVGRYALRGVAQPQQLFTIEGRAFDAGSFEI